MLYILHIMGYTSKNYLVLLTVLGKLCNWELMTKRGLNGKTQEATYAAFSW